MLDVLKELLIEYPLIAPILFVLVRAVPVVFAPIPGLLLDIVGISVFGWLYGFLLAEAGVMLGSIIAFLIGRYFREPIVRRFASLKKIHEWESQYSENQKFWSLVAARVATSPFFDYVSYAAGLTKMNLRSYVLSTFIGTLPFMFSIYYFGSSFIKNGLLPTVLFLAFLGAISYVWSQYIRRQKEVSQ